MTLKKAQVSSSISNWREKILKRYSLEEAVFPWNIFKPIIFFGVYNLIDFLKLFFHRGKRIVFWCGSDLRDLNWWKKILIKNMKARHVCETMDGELDVLLSLRKVVEVLPQFFGDIGEFQPCFKPSKTPHVFMNCHVGREKEYGLSTVQLIAEELPEFTFHVYGIPFFDSAFTFFFQKNIVFHGKVSEKQFNEEIRYYQAGLRLNKFDGNSDIVMKSVLLGQYPITYLNYDQIDSAKSAEDLIEKLRELKKKKAANPASDYWRERLNHTRKVLLQEEQNQI